MGDITAAEALRHAEQVRQSLMEHERVCGERWKAANSTLQQLHDFTVTQQTTEKLREQREETHQRKLQRSFWWVGALIALTSALSGLLPWLMVVSAVAK